MTGETKPTHEIVIRRTITLTQVVEFEPFGNYGDKISTPEEAAEYERNLSEEDKVMYFIEALGYVDHSDIDFGETVTVQEIREN